jgi:hypothetical protein
MTHLRLREADLHWREIDGEIIALEARDSTYVATNPAGALLWRALSAGTTREGLTDVLVREFGIPRAQGATDIDRFLAELDAEGLLVR